MDTQVDGLYGMVLLSWERVLGWDGLFEDVGGQISVEILDGMGFVHFNIMVNKENVKN